VVIRTREYLCAVMPRGNALLMNLLRYPAEVVAPEEYAVPAKAARVGKAELAMAKKLVQSMSGEWQPRRYKDEFRARLQKVVAARLKHKETVEVEPPEDETTESVDNVVDFVALLKQSLDHKGGNARTRSSPRTKADAAGDPGKAPRKRSARKRALRRRRA
jgi:DNA end-binding protein Ku